MLGKAECGLKLRTESGGWDGNVYERVGLPFRPVHYRSRVGNSQKRRYLFGVNLIIGAPFNKHAIPFLE